MTFAWPWALPALLIVPLVLGVAWWSRRRRRRAVVRVTSVALVRSALGGRTLRRRRIPAALLVAGLAVLAVGIARPQASVAVPSSGTTILLALDVSGSMCSTDVPPNRLTAAQAAAAEFIGAQPSGARIGLVTFAGVAGVLVPPTEDTEELLAALRTLTTSRGTAIGAAILTSIDAIADLDPSVPPTGAEVAGAAPGDYAAATIVVLTDGANTQGVEPETAAAEAAARGLRVYTIGFGTTTPAPLVCPSSQLGDNSMGQGGYGRGGGGGGRSPLIADDDTLEKVATVTGGQFYRAENADQLQGALGDLPRAITVTRQDRDLAGWFAGLGGLLVATAVGLSLWWGRVRRPA